MPEAKTPIRYGGCAFFTTWAYKYGQYSIFYTTIYQDQFGVIRQQKSGKPSRDDNVIVGSERNPSPKGFALVGWNQDVQGGKPLEVAFDNSLFFFPLGTGISSLC